MNFFMDSRIWNFVEDLMQMMFGPQGVKKKRFNGTLRYLKIKAVSTQLVAKSSKHTKHFSFLKLTFTQIR